MKRNKYFIKSAIFVLIMGISACTTSQSVVKEEKIVPATNIQKNQPPPKPPMPAFQSEESAKNLPATLSPDLFKGETKAAYAAVKEIPEVIAQLPCYCRCDREMGHKSLHTCYVDDHASQCGVCMNSALKARKLKKEKKTIQQIRDALEAEYGK